MNNFVFTPDVQMGEQSVPFFEDARADYAPYYSSRQSLAEAKAEMMTEMGKLGAMVFRFQEGWFGVKPKRYGYLIEFTYLGAMGRIKVAGLPIRVNVSPDKIDKVRVQALLNVRDWLKASVTQQVFSPGAHPLLMNLLAPGGEMTVGEYMMRHGRLALETSRDEVLDGEFAIDGQGGG